jgi:hypothetical protein
VIFARDSIEVAAALAAAAVLAVGCGKSDAPKVDAKTEQAEANKRAREDVFGSQVKAIDNAKALPDDINKKAQENLDKADAMSK